MRQAKQYAIDWAKEIVADPAAVFLDTETTGTGKDAEIVDIAIVSVDGTVLLDTSVCPVNLIPPEATAIHGLSDEDVAESIWWEILSPRVAAILHGRQVVVYNAAYDFPLVSRLWERRDDLKPLWSCAMVAYGAYDGTEVGWRGGFKWWKLGQACEHFGIQPSNHRAMADAEACRQLVIAMASVEGEPRLIEEFSGAKMNPIGDVIFGSR